MHRLTRSTALRGSLDRAAPITHNLALTKTQHTLSSYGKLSAAKHTCGKSNRIIRATNKLYQNRSSTARTIECTSHLYWTLKWLTNDRFITNSMRHSIAIIIIIMNTIIARRRRPLRSTPIHMARVLHIDRRIDRSILSAVSAKRFDNGWSRTSYFQPTIATCRQSAFGARF